MIAQAGLFTIHQHPWEDLTEINPGSCKDFDLKRLHKWIVPKKAKTRIVERLEKYGVNSRTLLPELDGLAQGLWRNEVLWHGEVRPP